jgi:hypothetical protein
MVDVKGQSTRKFWLIQRREIISDLYYVLVYSPRNGLLPRYFILTGVEMMEEREEYRRGVDARGSIYKDDLNGMNWGTALQYEDRWAILPS